MKANNPPRCIAGPAPAPPTGGKLQKFWNIASTGDDTGEILLYGDVMSSQPIDCGRASLSPASTSPPRASSRIWLP